MEGAFTKMHQRDSLAWFWLKIEKGAGGYRPPLVPPAGARKNGIWWQYRGIFKSWSHCDSVKALCVLCSNG